MSSRYDEIMKGLNEAIAFEQGNLQGVKKHKYTVIEVSDFLPEEIKQIRLQMGMTQNIFAACIGVTKKAVEAWERGSSRPDGAARRTLGIIRKNPRYFLGAGVCVDNG